MADSPGARGKDAEEFRRQLMASEMGQQIFTRGVDPEEFFRHLKGAAVLRNFASMKKILEAMKQYLQENRNMIMFILMSGLIAVFPALVVEPMLALLGFSSTGPVVGESGPILVLELSRSDSSSYTETGGIAAGLMTNGPWVAGTLLPTLQSAAMGGYGVAAVYGAVSGIAIAVPAVVVAGKHFLTKIKAWWGS